MQKNESMPAWLAYGVPAVIFLGGLHAMITQSFIMAGGAKGGTSAISGTTAVWIGIGMIGLSTLIFVVFRYIGRKG